MRLTILSLTFLALVGCGPRPIQYTSSVEPEGQGELFKGYRNGKWTQANGPDKLFWEGNYANGIREGTWKEWNEDGSLRVSATYRKGKLDGVLRTYYSDGVPDDYAEYTYGNLNGISVDSVRGDISSVKTYNNGTKSGLQISYHSALAMHASLVDGSTEQVLLTIDEQGRMDGYRENFDGGGSVLVIAKDGVLTNVIPTKISLPSYMLLHPPTVQRPQESVMSPDRHMVRYLDRDEIAYGDGHMIWTYVDGKLYKQEKLDRDASGKSITILVEPPTPLDLASWPKSPVVNGEFVAFEMKLKPSDPRLKKEKYQALLMGK